MIVVLIRHGNTFAQGDTPTWVGRAQDLPLVPAGYDQAHAVGRAILPISDRILGIRSAGLKRSQQTAECIRDEIGREDLVVEVDGDLDEIDYGKWGGLTTEEIQAAGFSRELSDWNVHGTYPENCGWSTTEASLMSAVARFLTGAIQRNRQDGIEIAVTSNGTLRYFLRHAPEHFQRRRAEGTLKVRTGSICALRYCEQNQCWEELFWNLTPAEFHVGLFDGHMLS